MPAPVIVTVIDSGACRDVDVKVFTARKPLVVFPAVDTAVRFAVSAVGPVAEPRNAVVLLESMVQLVSAVASASAASVKVRSAVTGEPATPEV